MRIYRVISIFLVLLLLGNGCFSMEVQASAVGKDAEKTDSGASGAEGDTSSDEADDKKTSETGGKFYLDNSNRYEGMDRSYSEGYMPKVENGCALLVIPLQCNREIKDGIIRAALGLGEGDAIPFVYKNYEKKVGKGKYLVNDGSVEEECYLVSFPLELKGERVNGSYPVMLKVSGNDVEGNEIEQTFTIYVTITDGKDPNQEPQMDQEEEKEPEKEPPVFAPKVLVQSYQFSKEMIKSGDTVTAEITLVNTSKANNVKNMTVTVTPCEGIALMSQSDSIYIEKMGKNETIMVTFDFQVNAAAAQGQYNIGIAMDYADYDGNTYTSAGTVKMPVGQLVKMKFDPLSLPKEVAVGETIEAVTQAMNLGRGTIYNVRAEIAADGLKPSQTMFIGDIEAGTAASGSAEITVEGLNGTSMYGDTEGTITFYYEDEAGNELSESMSFSTTILSPIKEKENVEPEDNTRQWWVIMAVIIGTIVAILTIFIIRRIKWKKDEDK